MSPNETDWDAIDAAIVDAAIATDAALVGRISSLTRLTDEEVKQLFPKQADAQKLAELMKIVRSATDHNTKVANLIANIENLGGTVVKLVDKLA